MNMDLLFKNDTLISLGYNCCIKRFFDSIVPKETNFFDYIGTSMWAITELFENNFQDIFNTEYYKQIEILENQPITFLSNTKYYIRFLHDLECNSVDSNPKLFLEFKSKYERRIKRLDELINSSNKTIFIRYEESLDNRIIYKEFEEKIKINEYEYVKKFSSIIKSKYPNKKFKIIYLTKTLEESNDIENNILLLNISNYTFDWVNCVEEITKIFNDKYDFIKKYL